jgi:twitching motility protein PilT
MKLDELLGAVAEGRASDLHLRVGNYPHMRIDGQLQLATRFARVSAAEMEETAFGLMADQQKGRF